MNEADKEVVVLKIPRSWPLFLGALLINLLIWTGLFHMQELSLATVEKKPLLVRPISAKEWQAIHRFEYTQGSRKIVQSDESAESETADPFPAEFLGEKNRRVKKETVSRGEDPSGSLEDPATSAPTKNPRRIVKNLFSLGEQIPLLVESKSSSNWANASPEKTRRDHSRRLSMDDLGKSVEMGAHTMLNTDEYRFYGFVSRIKEAVYPLWRRNLNFYGGQTHVASGQYVIRGIVVMNPEGSFQKIEDWVPSGINAFDRSVEEAFRDLPRIPNPPKEMVEEDGLLRLKFSFRVDNESSNVIVDYQRGSDDDFPTQAR